MGYPQNIYINKLPLNFIQYSGSYELNSNSGDFVWLSTSNRFLGISIPYVYLKKDDRNPIYNWSLYDKYTDDTIMSFKIMKNGKSSDIIPEGSCVYSNTVFSINDTSFFAYLKAGVKKIYEKAYGAR